jgi:hypothetical protein
MLYHRGCVAFENGNVDENTNTLQGTRHCVALAHPDGSPPRVTVKNSVEIEAAQFYSGFGWLTDEERFNLRQTDPRLAP